MSGEIVIVGLGPGALKYLTAEAKDTLLSAEAVYFRFSAHPVFSWLQGQGRRCLSFDALYAVPGISYDKIYNAINETLIKAAKAAGRAVYALPGNPYVFEKTPRWLKPRANQEGVSVRVVVGLSFLEMTYLELELDPEEGLQILNANGFAFYGDYPFTPELPLLIGQVGLPGTNRPADAQSNVAAVTRSLRKKFPADHPVTLIWSTGMPDYENRALTMPLAELPGQAGYVQHLASLYVPPLRPPWETARASSAAGEK